MRKLNLVLGTMTFGQQVARDESLNMIELFLNRGYDELDTAYVYNDGDCEILLGDVLASFDRDRYKIATKANPRITGKLDGEAVSRQLKESLNRLKLEQVDIFYLHFPDRNTPVDDALSMCDQLYREGYFRELGLSNFPAWMVADVANKCEHRGWIRPTVFQGVYNPVARKAETELFDALKTYGMRFYAYNPLAGGLLTGKYCNVGEKPSDGRFALRKAYPGRYWKESFFKAIDVLRCACNDMNMAEAVLRWLVYHSKLDSCNGDAIIIGASNIVHLNENMNSVEKGPLPDHLIAAFDDIWLSCRTDAPEYFTFYKGIKND